MVLCINYYLRTNGHILADNSLNHTSVGTRNPIQVFSVTMAGKSMLNASVQVSFNTIQLFVLMAQQPHVCRPQNPLIHFTKLIGFMWHSNKANYSEKAQWIISAQKRLQRSFSRTGFDAKTSQ